jgi:hypothetical protein
MKRLALAVALLAPAYDAGAQCVMCFRTASAQQKERARVLNAGILVLGAPPFLILGGLVYLAFKRSRDYRE